MPKMKTKRAAAKRLKATASGKLKRAGGWKQHHLELKSPISAADQPRLKRLVPYL